MRNHTPSAQAKQASSDGSECPLRRVSRVLAQAGREQPCMDLQKRARRVLHLVHPDTFAAAH